MFRWPPRGIIKAGLTPGRVLEGDLRVVERIVLRIWVPKAQVLFQSLHRVVG